MRSSWGPGRTGRTRSKAITVTATNPHGVLGQWESSAGRRWALARVALLGGEWIPGLF